MQGYATKRVPKMIRGIMMALICAVASAGSIIYLQVTKPFYVNRPNMVFGMIGVFDAAVLILIIVAILLGKYGDPAPQEDTFDEVEGGAKSMRMENQTADFIKDDDYIDDDIPDVPLYQDIYDEHIPEMSSDFEASSFHTKRFGVEKSGRMGSKAYDDQDVITSKVYDENENDLLLGSIRQTKMVSRNDNTTLITSKISGDELNIITDSYRDPLLGANRGDFNAKSSTVNKSDEDEYDGQGKKKATRDQTVVARSHQAMEYLEVKDNRFRKTSVAHKGA